QYGTYTEDSAEYQLVLDRLVRKFHTAREFLPKPVVRMHGTKTDVAIVSLGSCDGAVQEAIDVLKRMGVVLDYMRVRAFPFGDEVEKFLAGHRKIFAVEQNRDAQLRSLLTLETGVEKAKLRSLLHYDGLPISSQFIIEGVLAEVAPGGGRLKVVPVTQKRATP
ncbi:MAG: 2-oxoacid:acceptor oxidoreductase subunit alpha, partial [Steroidobacteraceae bacterium]